MTHSAYSRLEPWVEKAWTEMVDGSAALVVMLLPANRCEQGFWQRHIEPYRDGAPLHGVVLKTRFLPNRMRFGWPESRPRPAKGDRPPFGCVLLTWGRPRGTIRGRPEMTQQDAGRELDALVAEKVMGFRPAETTLPAYPRHYTDPGMPEHHQATPHYSTDIAAAWSIVEKLRADAWELSLTDSSRENAWGQWEASFGRGYTGLDWDDVTRALAKTAPLAICIAALATLESKSGSTP